MERERVLITGISGFVGSHLAEFLLERDMEVYGTIRWRSKLDNIKHIQTKIGLIETDIKLWRHYGVGKVEFGKPSFN